MTKNVPVGSSNKRKRFERKRDLVVDAATRIVNDKGVAGLTFAEVAGFVGLSTSSVTYYFRLKEDLAAAAFQKTLNRIEKLVAEAALEVDPVSRVSTYVRLYFRMHEDIHRGKAHPIAILSEMRALDDSVREPLSEHYSTIFKKIRGFFDPADNDRQSTINTARAQHLTEAMYWLPVWLFDYSYDDFDRVYARVMELFQYGLALGNAPWDPESVTANVDEQAVQNQADFLRVATRLISDRGYRGASVDRIAAELKVTKGSFYHHLEAKNDLVLSCFSHSYAKIAAVQGNARGKNSWQRLISIFVKLLDIQFSREWPLMRATAIQTLPRDVRRTVYTSSNRAALRFAGIIADGISERSIRAVDPLVASQIIMSSLNAAYELHNWANRQGDHEKAIRLYASALVHGLFDDRSLA